MQSIKDKILEEYNGIQESFDAELLRSFDVEDNAIPTELINPDKVKLNKDKFRLSGDGVFYTIQGEGITMGMPSIFVRLHICNLRCVWCDAYYTWNPKSKEFWTESYEKTSDELIATIEEKWLPKDVTPRVIFTGGEPMLQQDLIIEVLNKRPDWNYEIETNGTIMPKEEILNKFQFNCSPKLNNSKNLRVTRYKPEVIKELNKYNTQFKFVVMTNEDIKEMEDDFLPLIDKSKVVLMPQGVSAKEVNDNAIKVVEYAKEKGYRLLDRLHVNIWGAKRKV
jgi:organic radical activating enzyme